MGFEVQVEMYIVVSRFDMLNWNVIESDSVLLVDLKHLSGIMLRCIMDITCLMRRVISVRGDLVRRLTYYISQQGYFR